MIAWPGRGRLWLVVGQVACLAAIVVAGRASAERAAAGGQAAWVAIALAAAVISAAGNGVWLGAVRRAASTRRQSVFGRLAEHAGPPAVTSPAGGDGVTAQSVMVAGLTLRHRPDCPLVAGKAVVPAGAETAPCGWCAS